MSRLPGQSIVFVNGRTFSSPGLWVGWWRIPCRLGLKRMRELLEEISCGSGSLEGLTELESLSEAVKDGALCGLGNSAPNPVLTTLRYFRDEYESHIFHKKCPAAVCKELINYAINPVMAIWGHSRTQAVQPLHNSGLMA